MDGVQALLFKAGRRPVRLGLLLEPTQPGWRVAPIAKYCVLPSQEPGQIPHGTHAGVLAGYGRRTTCSVREDKV